MRVLVAEDDPISRRLIERTLAKWGYDVIVACDGHEAMNVLRYAHAPRLAILDWMMPGMDGLQICREMRRYPDEPYTYIILLTAKSQRQDIIQGLDAGADDYITKPFDTHELKARLRAGNRILDLQSALLTAQEELQDQATHDFLTGLPNRLLFSDRLTQRLAEAQRNSSMLSIMFLDLDRFKLINDGLGHNVGDLLLKQVAERLTSSLRGVDTVARMGGDEFTVILSSMIGSSDATTVADRVISSFSEPFQIDEHQLYVTTSIGISVFPTDGADVETLVRSADTAMYRAKEHGGNRYQFCTDNLVDMPGTKIKLENSLRRALGRNELVLHYQPRVNCKTGSILGAEALIRWQHPELGLVFPNQFIPLAEETGLIVPIGEWVVRTACAQNKAWQNEGLPPMEVAVNISARQLQHGDLVATVGSALKDSELDPQYLWLELTESTLMQNPDRAGEILRELKDMGVRISIDDFGTGHSSLSYLKDLPTDSIKIDRSFLKNITHDPDNAAIAGAVIAMAHSLNLKVVAEGIETIEQLEFLRSLNCDEMQGYFVSRPVARDSFAQMLECERPTPAHRARKAA
jgi:diguanylate cyclase (GGDEF)-like protein